MEQQHRNRSASYGQRKHPQQTRRRRRRRRSPLRQVALLLIVVICVLGVIANCRHRDHVDESTHDLPKSDVKTEQGDSGEMTKEAYIDAHSEQYPQSLLELLERNPETVDFVYDYPEAGNRTPEIDLSGEVTQGTVPLFLQWDERWGYQEYGSDMLAVTGCGPTCLSMVYSGLTGNTDKSPLEMARFSEEQGYYSDGVGTAWTLMSQGAVQLGLNAQELPLTAQLITEQLNEGHPIICTMGPGDFTDSGHYIVLRAVNADGSIALNDPNSPKNSEISWDLEQLMEQMDNLWAYSLPN